MDLSPPIAPQGEQKPKMDWTPLTPNTQTCQGEQKSKMVAGILGIVLGGFGVHRFYLGYVGIGIAQIVATIILCGAGVIWGFVEGVLILAGKMNTDANGMPLKD